MHQANEPLGSLRPPRMWRILTGRHLSSLGLTRSCDAEGQRSKELTPLISKEGGCDEVCPSGTGAPRSSVSVTGALHQALPARDNSQSATTEIAAAGS